MIPIYWIQRAIIPLILFTISWQLVQCLSIDNNLNVIKNDCYERLAIGQKLRFNDIDKILLLSTVQDCQLACTHEEKNCRSFSFGIGIKGNSTCELSKVVVKETPDLKPIGTLPHVDFDLYIKKLGCKLVINKDSVHNLEPKPLMLNVENGAAHNTKSDDYDYGSSQRNNYNYNYENKYIYASKWPAPRPAQSSLISVASSPNAPEHLVSTVVQNTNHNQRPSYGTGKPYYPNRFHHNDGPRPVDSHYGDHYHRPGPQEYEHQFYNPMYRDRFNFDYKKYNRPNRPDKIPDRPENYGDYDSKPLRPFYRPDTFGYDISVTHSYDEPKPSDHASTHEVSSETSVPTKVTPSSTEKNEKFNQTQTSQQPEGHYYEQPSKPSEVPDTASQTDGNYNSGDKFNGPQKIPARPTDYYDPNEHDNSYGSYNPEVSSNRPHRPIYNDYYGEYSGDGFQTGYGSYHSRPEGPVENHRNNDRRPSDAGGYSTYENAHRPHRIPEQPADYYDRYGPYNQNSGPYYPNRPNDVNDYYDEYYEKPSKPYRPFDVVDDRRRPQSSPGVYGPVHHQRPYEIPSPPSSLDYDTRPYRPTHPRPSAPGLHDKPSSSSSYGSYDRPSHARPVERPHRPSAEEYDKKPYRPIRPRPIENEHKFESKPPRTGPTPGGTSSGYGNLGKPNRPHIIPSRPPPNDYYNKKDPMRYPDRDSYGTYLEDTDDYRDDASYYERPSYNQYNYNDEPFPPNNRYDYDDYGSRPKPYRPRDEYSRPPSYYDDYRRNSYNDRFFILPWDKRYYDSKRPDSYYDRVLYDNDFKRPVYVPKVNYHNKTYDEDQQPRPDDRNSTGSNGTRNFISVSKTNGDPQRKYLNRKPIVSATIGSHGETITSIITEIPNNSCFRRVLAGKRVVRNFVRRAVLCERVEDCQRECSEEKRFVCEGFNYRLDPTGRSQGDCELIDLPLSRLDVRLDVYDDPEYDYYERDRNSNAPDCKGTRFYGYRDNGYQTVDRRYDDYNDYSREYYDDYYRESGYDYKYEPRRPTYDDRLDPYDGGNRRGGKNFNYFNDRKHHSDKYDYHHKTGYSKEDNFYKPIYSSQPYDYKSYEPYLPQGYWKYEGPYYDTGRQWDKYFHERVNDRNYWGFSNEVGGWGNYGGSYGNFGAPDSYYDYDYYNDNHRNNNNGYVYEKKYFYIPANNGGSKDWGHYGGSYGHGGHDDHHFYNNKGKDYWGVNGNSNGLLPPYEKPPTSHQSGIGNGVLYDPNYQNVLKDECSLRMVTGFRLHKGILKKITSVSSIYECELLCYKERDFLCNSYAFRYSTNPNTPAENCYLSDRDYKELDHYTDLEPDRDCDVYKMHNQERCDAPITQGKDQSDCFIRVRSSHRLDHTVVRDSLNVKSIVDCELECLRSLSFTCRAFSYRYGPPNIRGAIDNCQLTDRSYLDLNHFLQVVPESGFEIYERGSYGHGCEPNHFQIGQKPKPPITEQLNQICYLGYGAPSKLLPQATKKSVRVNTEDDCKTECTRARDSSLFQCMSLSYRTLAPPGSPNCDLSDIVQRDLLSDVDYVADPNAWLFAWDTHNPTCIAHLVISFGNIDYSHILNGNGIDSHGHGQGHAHGHGYEHGQGHGHVHIDGHDNPGKEIVPWINPGDSLNTWKLFSVGGLPCKRGTLCKENKVAGFWYCELEGREEHAWDYCCRPDHQCGYSEGFQYQWCYVGPERTQWRKCNEQYFPYSHNSIDYHQSHHAPLHPVNSYSQQWASSNSVNSIHVPHSKSPSGSSAVPNKQPTLTNHGSNSNQFLDPPKPGGFNQPRHWPISYLHKEIPPNSTYADYRSLPKERSVDSKTAAISNLINTIKSNDLKGVQYQISKNESDYGKSDETLYVQIPLPSSFNSANKIQKTREVDRQSVNRQEVAQPNENATVSNSKRNDQIRSGYSRALKQPTQNITSSNNSQRKDFETRSSFSRARAQATQNTTTNNFQKNSNETGSTFSRAHGQSTQTTTLNPFQRNENQSRSSYSRGFITRANRTLTNQRRLKTMQGLVEVTPLHH